MSARLFKSNDIGLDLRHKIAILQALFDFFISWFFFLIENIFIFLTLFLVLANKYLYWSALFFRFFFLALFCWCMCKKVLKNATKYEFDSWMRNFSKERILFIVSEAGYQNITTQIHSLFQFLRNQCANKRIKFIRRM